MKSKLLILCVSLAVAATLIASTSYTTRASGISYNGTSIDANLNATATPEHIALSWTGDPTTTQTITWRTISSDTKNKVQYRVKGTTAWQQFSLCMNFVASYCKFQLFCTLSFLLSNFN